MLRQIPQLDPPPWAQLCGVSGWLKPAGKANWGLASLSSTGDRWEISCRDYLHPKGTRSRRSHHNTVQLLLSPARCWELHQLLGLYSATPKVSPAVYLLLKCERLKINRNRLSERRTQRNQKLRGISTSNIKNCMGFKEQTPAPERERNAQNTQA